MDTPTVAHPIQLYFIEDNQHKIDEIRTWTKGFLDGHSLGFQFDPVVINSARYLTETQEWLASFRPECQVPTYLMVDGNIQVDADTLILPADENHGNGIELAHTWFNQFIASAEADGEDMAEFRLRIRKNLRILFSTRDASLFNEDPYVAGDSGQAYRTFSDYCKELGIQTFVPGSNEPRPFEFEVARIIGTDLQDRRNEGTIEGSRTKRKRLRAA